MLQRSKFFILKRASINFFKSYHCSNICYASVFDKAEQFDDDETFKKKNSYSRNVSKFDQDYSFQHRRNSPRRSGFGSSAYFNSGFDQKLQFKQNIHFKRKWQQRSEPKLGIDETHAHFEKFFYIEHPDVANRSEEDVELFRKMMNICIKGTDSPKPITKFEELCLPESLMAVLSEESYDEPTPIQAQSWPVALSGRDLIGVSQTGSGKTLAYMIPAIVHAVNQKVSKSGDAACKPQILVLGPTRELVQQIHQVSGKFIQACGLSGACVYGGASKSFQLNSLYDAEICIATPGRLIDFLRNQEVSLDICSYLVLDEADRMLDMGFEPQIRDIIDHLRGDRQTLMWSATWPSEIRNLAEEFLTDYIHITIGSGELSANPNIEQKFYCISEDAKEEKLFSLLSKIFAEEETKVLVFAQTKRKVDYLSHILNENGIQALCIHGDVSQYRRDNILKNFRRNKSSVLIATDVAARGLDISDVHHVVNFDFPLNIEDYIHRIGRTARGSACGVSHSFFTSENAGLLKDLFSVLQKSNQEIDPELYSLAEKNRHSSIRYNNQRTYRRRFY